MKKLFCFALFLTACAGEEKKTGAGEETKAETAIRDSVGCFAEIKKELILNDSALTFPIVILKDTTATHKIKACLTLLNVTGYSPEEIKQQKEDYKKDSLMQGLTDLNFEVTYNTNCLLSMSFFIGTMGAHASGFSAYYNFDVSTGDSVFIYKLLDETKINTLVKLCNDAIQKRIATSKKEHATDDFVLEQLTDKKFTRADLSVCYITNTHVVFVFNFGFPHVIQSAEPDNFIKIPREEFRKYLKINPYSL